jgi:serine/threonine protein kinase
MDKRYEVKEQIGQGGLGCVYCAHDQRMNREVAIKRIQTNSEDTTISEEATRQLMQEASALAALQHPNIVTIHDVGIDDESPYVVMELLTGDTLEEIIVEGSLTWADFRELAMQTMEALIAAQELHIVHRDLKPGNLMLTWLPSGKFQIKVLDFGLATLSPVPFLQAIDKSDGVFGSIYFMAPEQFERVPIDLKADLYAIGCVFYYALTGTYPFDGETAADVMNAHLQHTVTPLQVVREGIPLWACDWIMSHINRQVSDRPESARESLRHFIENDAQSDQTLSTGLPTKNSVQAIRSRLLVPGVSSVPEIVAEAAPKQPLKTASPPKPLAPPRGSKPSIHAPTQIPKPATILDTKDASTRGAPVTIKLSTTAKSSPTNPLVVTSSAPTQFIKNPNASSRATSISATAKAPMNVLPVSKKPGISNGAKTTIAAVLGILVLVLVVVILKTSARNAETKLYNAMLMQAAGTDATEVSVDKNKLEILLRSAATVGANREREGVFLALVLAKSIDGTDVDARITEFSTKEILLPNIRNIMIRDVIRKRNNPAVVEPLLEYARSTNEPLLVTAAIEATRYMAQDKHFPEFISFIVNSTDDSIRKTAEDNAVKIIEKSSNKTPLGEALAAAYHATKDLAIRHTMLRLLGGIGNAKALELTRENIKSDGIENQIAAISALAKWPNSKGFPLLIDYLISVQDIKLRSRAFDSEIEHRVHNALCIKLRAHAFDSAFTYLSNAKDNSEMNWDLLSKEAKTQDEQTRLIRSLTAIGPEKWVLTLLEEYANNADEENENTAIFANKALKHLRDIEKIQTKGGKSDQ